MNVRNANFTQELRTYCAQFPSVYNVKVRYNIWGARSYFSSVLFAPEGRMCAQKKKNAGFSVSKSFGRIEERKKILTDDLGLKTTPPPLFIFYLCHNRKTKNKIYFKKLFSNAFLTFNYLPVITEKNMLFSLYCDINLVLYLMVV